LTVASALRNAPLSKNIDEASTVPNAIAKIAMRFIVLKKERAAICPQVLEMILPTQFSANYYQRLPPDSHPGFFYAAVPRT
jgi:hypothetical protein